MSWISPKTFDQIIDGARRAGDIVEVVEKIDHVRQDPPVRKAARQAAEDTREAAKATTRLIASGGNLLEEVIASARRYPGRGRGRGFAGAPA